MIKTEKFTVNNFSLVHTYSDEGFRIRKEGTDEIYDEAIDPEDSGRVYIETDELVNQDAE